MKKTVLCALVLAPTLAFAQGKASDDLFKEGETQYNLGNFDGAIKAWKEAFAAEPKPAYLYNIAQAYRQLKDCSNAQFFYKRFLSLKEGDTVKPLAAPIKKEVEDRIRELEACAREQEAIKNRPPDGPAKPDGPDGGNTTQPDTTKPDTTKPDTTKVGTKPDDDEEGEEEQPEDGLRGAIEGQPKLLSARIIGGGSKLSVGDLSVPLQTTFGLTGGYPLPLNEKMTLEVGLGLRFTRVKWDAMETTGKTGTSSLTAVMANGAVTYEVAPKMAVRGDLGLGLLFFGNASQSPFTERAPTEGGALAMFHLRAGAAFDYAVTPNVVATVPLAFSFSPKKDGMAGAVVSFDFMVGVGYRM